MAFVRKSRLRNMISPAYRKWIGRLIRVLVVLALLVLVVQALVLPRVVRYAVGRALASLGQAGAPFTVTSVTYYRAEIADVRIGAGEASAVSIAATYSPWSLLHGRLHTIRCTGVEVSLAIENGRLRRIEALPGSATAASEAPSEFSMDLPFDRLEVRSSTLHLQWEGRKLFIPLDGDVDLAGGVATFALTARLQGTPVQANGRFASLNDYRVKLEAPGLETASLSAALPPRYIREFAILGEGPIDIEAEHHRTGGAGGTTVKATVWGLFLRGATGQWNIEARQLSGSVRAELDEAFTPRSLRLGLRATHAMVYDQALREVQLTVTQEGKGMTLDASADGSDFRVEQLHLAWHDVLSPGPPDRAQQVEGRIALAGRPPLPVRRAVSALGYNLRRLGPAQVTASFKAGWQQPSGAPLKWSLSSDDARLRIDPGDLSIVAANTTLLGLSGDLQATVHADQDGVRGKLLPDSQIRLRGIDPLPAAITLPMAAPGSALLEARVEREAVDWTIAGANWNAQAAAVRCTVSERSVRFPGTSLERASLTLLLGAQANASNTTVRLLEGSEIRAGSAQLTLNDDVLRSAAAQVALREPPGTAALIINHRTGAIAVNLRGEARGAGGAGPLLTSREMRIMAGPLHASAELLLGQGTPHLAGVVQFDKGEFHHQSGGVHVEGVSARVPFSVNSPVSEMGAFEVPRSTVGPAHLPPLAGHLALIDGKARFETHWSVLGDGVVQATGFVDLGAAAINGRVDAEMPAFALRDAKAMAQLVPLLEGYDITGTLAGRASLQFVGAQHTARVEASVRNGRMENKASQWLFEGIEVDPANPLVIESFTPLATRGGQVVKVGKAQMSSLRLSDGQARFRIESNDIIQVEAIHFGWAGGQLAGSAFRLDRRRPEIQSTLTADRIELEQFLAMFTERMTGTGQLYGRLPVEVRWPQGKRDDAATVKWNQPQLRFGEGFLYATPGSTGRIGFKNPEQFVGPSLDQDPRFRPGGVLSALRQGILGALEDLAYTVLKVDIIYKQVDNEPTLCAAVLISGKGAKGDPPQEIGSFRLNLNGIDEVLKRAIGYRGGISLEW